MEDLIATRESFGEELAKIENEKVVVLDADVATSTKTSLFKEAHPERFVECGIAEANMIGTSAGLASCGKIPVACTFATFATARCYGQIRASIAYPNLNVKIVGTHSGITAGQDGATHQMIEDVNLMRGLPNMTVINPADDISTRALVYEMINNVVGPVYMRLSKRKTEVIYNKLDKIFVDGKEISLNETNNENENLENRDNPLVTENKQDENIFKIGKGIQIGDGKDCTIFACGDVLQEALKAKSILAEKGINARVCDMYSIKPIDKDLIIRCAEETNKLFSLEDHSIIGGIGSAISEVLTDTEHPKHLVRLGMNDTFGKSGTSEELLDYFNLTGEKITNTIYENFNK